MSDDSGTPGTGEGAGSRSSTGNTAKSGGRKPRPRQLSLALSHDGSADPAVAGKRARRRPVEKTEVVDRGVAANSIERVEKAPRKGGAKRGMPADAPKQGASVEHAGENSIAPTTELGPQARAGDGESTETFAAAAVAPAGRERVSMLDRVRSWAHRAWQDMAFWRPKLDKKRVEPSDSHGRGQEGVQAGRQDRLKAMDRAMVVPDGVKRRFLQVAHEYYFLDQTPAFSDRGNQLATRGAHPDVLSALIDIARARGWASITVKGSEEFRRGAWKEAAQHGLVVVGYQPTALEAAWLATRPVANTVDRSTVEKPDREKERGDEALAKGTASRQARSAKIETRKDLVTPAASVADPALAKKAIAFQRNKPTFVVRKYPELVGAYGLVEAGKAFAAEMLPAAVRDDFVGMVQRHVVQQILSGSTVVGPQIYVSARTSKTRAMAKESSGKEHATGRTAPGSEIEKER